MEIAIRKSVPECLDWPRASRLRGPPPSLDAGGSTLNPIQSSRLFPVFPVSCAPLSLISPSPFFFPFELFLLFSLPYFRQNTTSPHSFNSSIRSFIQHPHILSSRLEAHHFRSRSFGKYHRQHHLFKRQRAHNRPSEVFHSRETSRVIKSP